MIVERLVWQAKFGQGDQVTEAFRTWNTTMDERFGLKSRILVDVTGPMFTVVIESEYRDMAHVAETETQAQAMYAEPAFQTWFTSWQQAVATGSRELYRVLE